ncbi:MAG: hypothetical protein OSA98_09290 [Rubripirellula sp.]|nr:hypothetical protein [Rubripirellula sp.]
MTPTVDHRPATFRDTPEGVTVSVGSGRDALTPEVESASCELAALGPHPCVQVNATVNAKSMNAGEKDLIAAIKVKSVGWLEMRLCRGGKNTAAFYGSRDTLAITPSQRCRNNLTA